MCLILWAYQRHPRYRLILAANRDEFYARPSLPVGYWPDHPQVIGGRDLTAGGTWMAVSRTGRVAAITNYRDPAANNPAARSRGELVAGFASGAESPTGYLNQVARHRQAYNGFNLLVADAAEMGYLGSRQGLVRRLEPGIYGLSNHLLDTDWPKVAGARADLERLVSEDAASPESLLDLLCDRRQPPDAELPETGVGLEWERLLAPRFIVSENYGTRSSTVLFLEHRGCAAIWEWTFEPGCDPPQITHRRFFRFAIPDVDYARCLPS